MKCGMITFHRAINFGAVLQTYALNKTMNNLGINCEVIDYHCPILEKQYKPFSLATLLELKKTASIILKNAQVRDNRENFEKFINKNIKMSKRTYKSREELELCNKEYDIFITGSDQVWSYYCAGFDEAYFLSFVDDNCKKNSYAASFGVESIPQQYKIKYNSLLKNFNKVSVREKQGAKLVKDIINRDVPVVLDPTFLLNAEEWKSVASDNNQDQKYILIYLLAETKSIFKFAEKIAREKNLKIVYIHDRLFNKKGVENLNKISPEKWLSLFINAEYIITNSFHGVAFAVNLNKQFYMEYLPHPAKVNSRLENVLRLFNLEDRCINENKESRQDINYTIVNKLLEKERQESLEYLRSLLNENK